MVGVGIIGAGIWQLEQNYIGVDYIVVIGFEAVLVGSSLEEMGSDRRESSKVNAHSRSYFTDRIKWDSLLRRIISQYISFSGMLQIEFTVLVP